MISPEKIVYAARSNWLLNASGLLLSFCASVVLVRAMPPELFAQYAAVLALLWLATLIFEAGANSGLTRYLAEAAQGGARGTFYRGLQRRRWLLGLALGVLFAVLGPIYARSTSFAHLAAQPALFWAMAAIILASLTRALAHYGLLALFETRKALVWEQGFLVTRSVVLATIACLGGGLWHLVGALLVFALVEAISADWRFSRIVGAEQAPLPAGFLNKAQGYGMLTVFDKACAALGSGGALLLLLAPFHPAAQLAFLALATDLAGKLISVTVMPMGNLVAPYLSQVSEDPGVQGAAVARVVKLSSLLYAFTVGAGVLLLPTFIPLVFGEVYRAAGSCVLALLVPAAFENWVRGACSPALLRNGHYRALATLNILQALATLATFWLVHRAPLVTAIVAVLGVRAAVSALNLVLLRRIVPAGSYRVPAQGALVAISAVAATWLIFSPFPLPPPAQFLGQGAVFALLFYTGLRWVILRDADTLRIAHRLTGRRTFARLLPPLPC